MLRAGQYVFLKAAATEDTVLAGRRPVQANDARIQCLWRRGSECVGAGVQLIARIGSVRGRHRVEVRQGIGIGARARIVGGRAAHHAARIQLRDLRRGQRDRRTIGLVLQRPLFV